MAGVAMWPALVDGTAVVVVDASAALTLSAADAVVFGERLVELAGRAATAVERHVHVPVVAGSWGDPVPGPGQTQRITCYALCQVCRRRIERTEHRSAPASADWPVGETLLSATAWRLAEDTEGGAR